MTTLVEMLLLTYLIIAAIAICATKRLLTSVIILTSFSVVMSVLWIMLRSPDLAITEAAVSTGISSIMFFVVLKKIRVMEEEHREEEQRKNEQKGPSA